MEAQGKTIGGVVKVTGKFGDPGRVGIVARIRGSAVSSAVRHMLRRTARIRDSRGRSAATETRGSPASANFPALTVIAGDAAEIESPSSF